MNGSDSLSLTLIRDLCLRSSHSDTTGKIGCVLDNVEELLLILLDVIMILWL